MSQVYRLSEPAELDLLEIWSYIARDNTRAADRMLASLIK